MEFPFLIGIFCIDKLDIHWKIRKSFSDVTLPKEKLCCCKEFPPIKYSKMLDFIEGASAGVYSGSLTRDIPPK